MRSGQCILMQVKAPPDIICLEFLCCSGGGLVRPACGRRMCASTGPRPHDVLSGRGSFLWLRDIAARRARAHRRPLPRLSRSIVRELGHVRFPIPRAHFAWGERAQKRAFAFLRARPGRTTPFPYSGPCRRGMHLQICILAFPERRGSRRSVVPGLIRINASRAPTSYRRHAALHSVVRAPHGVYLPRWPSPPAAAHPWAGTFWSTRQAGGRHDPDRT